MKVIAAALVLLSFLIAPATADLIVDLKARQAKIKTVSADFMQEKQTKLLVKPIKSTGSFFYKQPDRIRWEYTGSVNMQVIYDGKELWIYYPDLGEADRISGLPRYASLMQFDIASLSSDYDVAGKKENDILKLRFVPKSKGPLNMIMMEFRGQSPFPDHIQLEDTNGELTRISFSDVKLNKEVSDDTFRLRTGNNIRIRERSLK